MTLNRPEKIFLIAMRANMTMTAGLNEIDLQFHEKDFTVDRKAQRQ